MKTKQELENIKERLEKLSTELHELTDEELEQVTGGAGTDEFKVETKTGSKYEDVLAAALEAGVTPH